MPGTKGPVPKSILAAWGGLAVAGFGSYYYVTQILGPAQKKRGLVAVPASQSVSMNELPALIQQTKDNNKARQEKLSWQERVELDQQAAAKKGYSIDYSGIRDAVAPSKKVE